MTPTAAFLLFSFILNILRYTSRIRTSTLPLPNMHPPKPLSHQLGLYLHILIETPATTAFLFFPSSTLRAPQPHAHALIRQYGALLGSTSLVIAILLLSHPSDGADTTGYEVLERRVAGALVIYHVAPCLRAVGRIRRGERSRGMFGNPAVHLGLHIICIVALFASFVGGDVSMGT